MNQSPTFPPLLTGMAVSGSVDPFATACTLAAQGCDGGTLVHNVQADRLRAALVFAPEVALADAMAMLPVCGIGFHNALGALAPPEVAVQLTWDGVIRINGARCGHLQVAAATTNPDQMPDWLVVGIDVAILQTQADPGKNPDVTALFDEGCADIDPLRLLESWARHTLVWVNRWSDEGNTGLHREWLGLVSGVGDPIERGGHSGRFLGVDDRFGVLIRDAATTHLVPMSTLLGERE